MDAEGVPLLISEAQAADLHTFFFCDDCSPVTPSCATTDSIIEMTDPVVLVVKLCVYVR